jgi:hypothetical protein
VSSVSAKRCGLLVLAGILLVVMYATSYMSGCVFDGKQGFGDYALASRYDSVAFFAMVGELVCLTLAALIEFHRPHLQSTVAIAAILVGLPVNWYIAAMAASRGTIACGPV